MTPKSRRQRLNSLQVIAAELRQSSTTPAPDLTGSILDRVASERPFLDHKTRRLLWVGRAALALSISMVVLGVALTQRWAPAAIELVSRPAPLSNMVEVIRSEAHGRLAALSTPSAAAPSSSPTREESGGLLTLMTAAAPSSSEYAVPCRFCGPFLSPSQAARLEPSSAARTSAAFPSLADLKGAGASGPIGPGRLSLRLRSVTSVADRADAEATGKVVLNELTSLGGAFTGDSAALAPK